MAFLKKTIAFNDVLLVPQFNTIKSRLDVNLETKLTKNINISHPIIPTNMSTITEEVMVEQLDKTGGVAFLHRFLEKDKLFSILDSLSAKTSIIIPSIGVMESDIALLEEFTKYPKIKAVLIDIAHGHSKSVYDMIKFAKKNYSYDIIAGNVATLDGFKYLVDAGADAIRGSIGGGFVCSTRETTGFGYSTLQFIIDCEAESRLTGVPIIADGGIKKPADAVKALAFGASGICCGSIFAGTDWTPGKVKIDYMDNNKEFKEFYGMSSLEAQKKFKGSVRKGIASEGHYKLIPYKGEGSSEEVLNHFLGGIRSGLTYAGAKNIKELQENCEYTILSPGSIQESKYI